MIKFIRGESVSYVSNQSRLINVSLDIFNEQPSSPRFSHVLRMGDVLVVKEVELNADNSVGIYFYGVSFPLRFNNLVEARRILSRTGLKISTEISSCVTPTIYYKAHLAHHRSLDLQYSSLHSLVQATEAIDRLYNTLASQDTMYPRTTTDQMVAYNNDRTEFNLVNNAERRYFSTYNRAYPVGLLVENAPSDSVPVPNPWDTDIDYEEADDFDDTDSEEEPLWNRLGFESEDELYNAVEDYYWDLLGDEGVEHDDLNNSQRNSYRNRAFTLLVRDCTESINSKNKEVINNGKMLKFKDLINVNIKGAIRPAICLADLPANINLETIVPVLYKYKDEYIKATIPYIHIVNTLAKIEDIATRVKIKDFKESSDIFGYRKTKESVVGNIFSYVEIEKNFTCKKDGKVRDTIIVDLGKSDFRFVLSDVEFVLPQVNRVQLKKNKTIRIGSVCKIINNKGLNIPIGKKVEVLEVKATPQGASSKKLFRGSTNKRLDLATVKDIESGNTFKTYLKNLKFIQ